MNWPAVEQGSEESDEKRGPRHCQKTPYGRLQGLLCRGDTADRHTDRGLDRSQCDDIQQNPDDIVFDSFGLLPGVEVDIQSSQACEASVHCQSCCGDVDNLAE
jgi:hypothetical protein